MASMTPRSKASPAISPCRKRAAMRAGSGCPSRYRISRWPAARSARSTSRARWSQGDDMFRQRRSLFFKRMQIVRGCDAKRNTLVYMVYSDKLIDGSPKNSTSTVPIMPWGAGDSNPEMRRIRSMMHALPAVWRTSLGIAVADKLQEFLWQWTPRRCRRAAGSSHRNSASHGPKWDRRCVQRRSQDSLKRVSEEGDSCQRRCRHCP